MKRLSRLLLARSIVSVHVMHLVNVVIDPYRMPFIALFHKQRHCVVEDIVTPSRETDVDRSIHIELVAIARLLQVHHPYSRDSEIRAGRLACSPSSSSSPPNAADNLRAASARGL